MYVIAPHEPTNEGIPGPNSTAQNPEPVSVGIPGPVSMGIPGPVHVGVDIHGQASAMDMDVHEPVSMGIPGPVRTVVPKPVPAVIADVPMITWNNQRGN